MTAPQPQRPGAQASAGPPQPAARLLDALRAAPLRLRLFLIVFVGMLPLVLLSSGLLIYDARQQKQRLLEAAEDTMRAVIAAVDYESHESLAALEALAASPRLARGDMARFRAEALELMARRPEWANVMLSDLSGRHLMNAMAAPIPPLPQPGDLEAAVAGQQATIGNMRFSRQLGTYAFALRVPLLDEGRVRYLLTALIRPDAVQELLMSQAIPDGGLVAIFDRNRRVVARSSGVEEWLAKPASPDMLKLLMETPGPTAWGMTRTLEGIPVYAVFYRSERTGWSAAVGIPVNVLDAPIWRSYLGFGGLVVLAAALGLLASSVVSRSITRPMRELEASANRIRLGELPAMPKTGLPAVHNALAALVEAHRERERLLQSEQQARLLEQEARRIVDIGLPELDGYGVARAVRQRLGDEVRLIALTGYGTDEDVRRGAAAGFDDYLIKPVDPATLASAIQQWGAIASDGG